MTLLTIITMVNAVNNAIYKMNCHVNIICLYLYIVTIVIVFVITNLCTDVVVVVEINSIQ